MARPTASPDPDELRRERRAKKDLEEKVARLSRTIELLQKEMEECKASECFLRAVIDGIQDPVYAKDRDSRITLANEALSRVAGKPVSEIVGRTDSEYYSDPDVGRTLREHDLRVMESGQGYSVEEQVPTREGLRTFTSTKIPYRDASGYIVGIIGVSRDITERAEAEKKLLDSEQRYRSVFDNSLYGITLTRPDGAILAANKRACEMLGMTEEEIIRAGRSGLIIEDERLRAALAERTRTGQWQGELSARRVDGSIFPIEVSSSVFVNADGTETTSMAIQDITERRKAEEAVRASEQKFKAAFMTGLDGVYMATLEDGRSVEVNDEFQHIFGYTRQELIGRTSVELSLYKDPAARERIVSELTTRGRIKDFEVKGRKKNGEIITCSLSASVVHVGGIPHVLGVIKDITERKKIEEKLRESALQLSEAADLARIVYWEHDEETGEFIFNDAFYGLYATTAQQEGGYRMTTEEHGRRFVHPDDLEELTRRVAENRAARSRAGDLKRYEHRGVRRDGKVVHILTRNRVVKDPEGRVLKVVGVSQDITERKKVEEALRESETKLRAILENSRDAIVVAKDGIVTFANPACASLFGYESADEATGISIFDHVASESRPFVEEMAKKRAKGEPTPALFEAMALRKDGTIFLTEANVSAYVVKGEQFLLAIMRDITEKKRLEERLRQAQKMEAVGTLAGGVAHDFNNILTVIMGLGNILQMEIDKDVHRQHVDQIVASSEKAADLVRSLLAFSRKQRINPEPHTVSEVVASVAKLLTRLLPEDISLAMNLADADAVSLLDVSQISQVLMNLATNARDAMPQGGSLTITTERAEIDEAFEKTHGFGRPGEYVRLSVSDTGTGMDASTMERAFEPFFTTKEVGKGTGLGLSSAYGIVKQHSGYITVSSVPSKGTTVDVYLPLLKKPSRQKARVKGDVTGGTETILIVEDDRDVRNMLTKVLESHGYVTIEAVDGTDAIRVHREHDHVDLVILDVVMPGKNGKEALDEITRTDPQVKAIFMSGYTGDVVIDRGIASESVDFLQKPLSVTVLLAKVREVLDR